MRRTLFFLVALLLLALELPATAAISFSVISHSQYTDAFGDVHIVGEVQNTGTSNAAYVEVFFDLQNGSGTVVDTSYTQITAGVLGPGTSSPFHEIFRPPAGYAAYSVAAVEGETTTSQLNRNFDVAITSTFEESGREHTVGQVTNLNTTTSNSVVVSLTFHGSDGTVVDTDFALVNSGAPLAPGQSASFDSTRPADAPAYSTRSVFADSDTPPSTVSPTPTPTPTSTTSIATPTPTPTPIATSTYPSPSPTGSTSPTPDQPVIERTSSLSLRRHLVARGEVVADGADACLQRVTVKVQRKRPSRWRTVATITTTLEGVFRKRLPDRRGRYRAVIPKVLMTELVCAREVSPIRRHRHS